MNSAPSTLPSGDVHSIDALPSGSFSTAMPAVGPLQFQITYGAGVPDAVKTIVSSVTSYLSAHFMTPVTVAIDINWADLGSNTLGQTQNNFWIFDYASIVSQLQLRALSADDAATSAALPATSPLGSNAEFVATQAQANAWGESFDSSIRGPDATITFSSSAPLDFDNSDGVSAGSYDFYGVAAHEISEAMGRILWQGSITDNGHPVYMASDLFKYSGAGAHVYSSGTTAGYFSVDGGTTRLANYNTLPGGDFGDWSSTPNIQDAARAFVPTGTVEPLTDTDLRALDVIGWNRVETASLDLDPGAAGTGRIADFYEQPNADTGSDQVALTGNGTNFLTDTGSTRFTQLEISIADSQLAGGDRLWIATQFALDLTSASGTSGRFSLFGAPFQYVLSNDGATTSVLFTSMASSSSNTADSAPIANFQSLVGTLAYDDASDTPVDGSTRSFDVTANDGFGWSAPATFTVTVHATNDAPTGTVSITGTPVIGYVLAANTSTLGDPDGLGALSYQWFVGGTPVAGANSSTYAVQIADLNGPIAVTVSYTDACGTAESVTSAQTNTVTAGAGISNVVAGTSGNDFLVGLASADGIFGLAGDDTLAGGAGTDRLDGGDGSDLYLIALASEHSAAEFDDSGTSGVDEVRFTSAVASTLTIFARDAGIETVTETGTAALSVNAAAASHALLIEGNAGGNKLTGSAFADTLDGGAGADTLVGGNGSDTYFVDNAKDVVTETATGGADSVIASLGFTLGTNVENLTLAGGGAINGTGNALANTIIGNGAANVIDGKAGVDKLDGGDGADIYLVGLATDHAAAEIADSGTSGIDEARFAATRASTLTLFAGDTGIERVVIGAGAAPTAITTGTAALSVDASAVGNALTLIGNSGANTLKGTAFDDTLVGGAGNDMLTGGDGADRFLFNAPGKDTVLDFTPGTDVLQLSLAKFTAAGAGPAALDASAFWSAPGAVSGHDASDRVVYNPTTGTLYYDPDGNGSAAAIAVAVLGTLTHPALSASDIELVA